MDYFDDCMKIILEHEGGLSQDRKDPGGTTNFGISLKFAKEINPKFDERFILSLTKEQACDIYKREWWDKFKYDRFTKFDVVAKVFDMAVNIGSITSHKLLQESINIINPNALRVDGILGNTTIEYANTLDSAEIRTQLRLEAKTKYLSIVNKNPAMEWALKGWLKRAEW